MDIKEILRQIKELEGKEIEVKGWIRNHRKQKEFGFIDFSDGTCFKHIQLVYDNSLENFENVGKIRVGSSINVKGLLVKSPKEGQEFELSLDEFTLEGDCPDDYPLQAKGRPTREFLREIAYLRPRTNLFQAVFRVRSVVSYAIHKYFQDNGYVYVHTPLITANDGEGAGQMFQVTTLDLDRVKESGKLDYSKDFLTFSQIFPTIILIHRIS